MHGFPVDTGCQSTPPAQEHIDRYSITAYEDLKFHVGHDIHCVTYGVTENVAVECVTCHVVILDFDRPKS